MILKKLIIFIIDFYRYMISPLFPPSCRFYPSCSAYARQTFQIHGFFRAINLTVIRLLKCHPYHAGGVDLVPPRQKRFDNNGK